MLSDDAIAHLSREELVEHLHKVQELLARGNSLTPEERRLWKPPPQSQQQHPVPRAGRNNSSFQVEPHVFVESVSSPHTSPRRFKRVWRVGDEAGPVSGARFSITSQDEFSIGNTHSGDTASLISLLSEMAGVQATTLPDAIPVASTGVPLSQRSQERASFSVSTTSFLPQRPARVTDKASLARNEQGVKCINHYQIIKELGRGTCGKVQLAYDTENEMLVAIKHVKRVDTQLRIGGQTNAQMQFTALQREIAVMKRLRHKNIVPLYEVIDDPDAKRLYLVMMFIDKGPIGRVNCTPTGSADEQVCTPIPKDELAWYARQILAGLEYLHKHKIVHRDIKPEN
ncbi:putative protein kinase, partial [Trypanosoma conorhini]